MYEFARVKAYIEPIHISLENVSSELKSREKIISKMIDIKDCIISREIKLFSHVLKNHEVEWFINVKNAKGVNNKKTLTIIYLREYEKSKLNKLIETKLLIKPLKEKILKVVSLVEIVELIFWINDEKDIFLLKIPSPISLIDEEISELI